MVSGRRSGWVVALGVGMPARTSASWEGGWLAWALLFVVCCLLELSCDAYLAWRSSLHKGGHNCLGGRHGVGWKSGGSSRVAWNELQALDCSVLTRQGVIGLEVEFGGGCGWSMGDAMGELRRGN